MNKIRTYLAPLMALLGVAEAAGAAVWPWPQFNIAWAFLAVVSLLLAVFVRLGEVLQRSTPQRTEQR